MERGMETMKRFALTTSVKGIPRAVKTRSKPMRLLWMVCIIGFLTVAIVQAVVLTIDYLGYGTITTIYEYQPKGFTTNRDLLPDVSLCNTNPFGGHARMVRGVPTLKEFYDRVMNVTKCDNCSSSQRHSLEHLRKVLLTPAAYSVFIGPDNVRKIGHTIESMLVDCQLILLEGQAFTHVPCFPDTEVLYRYDLNYYNCYTLRLPLPSMHGLPHVGISLVIHLDDHFKEHRRYFDTTDVRTRMGGLLFSVHRPHTLSWGEFQGMFIPPGFLTDVKLIYKLQRRLKYPHGNCSDHFEMDLPQDMIYTKHYCMSSCILFHVSKACGCMDFSLFTELNQSYKNLTSCFDLDRSREDLLQMHQCVARERKFALTSCYPRCSIACNELYYDAQVRCTWTYWCITKNGRYFANDIFTCIF